MTYNPDGDNVPTVRYQVERRRVDKPCLWHPGTGYVTRTGPDPDFPYRTLISARAAIRTAQRSGQMPNTEYRIVRWTPDVVE